VARPLHLKFELYHDPVFWDTIRHTVIFFVVTFTVRTASGFAFAALLHSKVRLPNLYKVIIFVPVVLAPATMAPIFRQIFSATGQFNTVLSDIGLGSLAHPWLAQSSTALPVIVAITVWEWTGVTFILYFAAMTRIDKEIVEAARIDGANGFKVLTRIVWPNVRGTTIALAMLSVIGALKTFDVPYLINMGGPAVPAADTGRPERGGLRRPAYVGLGLAAAYHGGPAAGADGGHGHPHGPAGPRGRDGQPGGAGHLPGHPVEHRGTATKRS